MIVRFPLFLALAVVVAAVNDALAQQPPPAASASAELPKKFAALLDKAALAEQEGQSEQVIESLQPLFERAGPEVLAQADNRLKQTYNLGQTVAELLVAARSRLVLEGQGTGLRRPGKKELPLVLVDLADRAVQLQTPLEEELAVGFPALVPDPVIEAKLKELAPLLVQADQADALIAYLEELTKRLRRSDLAQLEGKAKEVAARDFAQERQKLGDLRDRLVERLVDFTLVRLNKAVDLLGNETASFQDRFAATERAAESLGTLDVYWDDYNRSRSRSPQGLDSNVETAWRAREAQFQQLAGPLLEKVYHYSEGVRWWLRGRYGMGHVAGGLAKIIPTRFPSSGARNDRLIAALRDYPLLMPRRFEKLKDPAANLGSYPIPYRHLEWWQLESRTVAVPVFRPTNVDVTIIRPSDGGRPFRIQTETAVPITVGNSMSESLRLAQLVGYLEYQVALYHFDRLLSVTTPAEQRALEDMAGEDDRLVVYSNLSRKYDALEPASTLCLATRSQHPKASAPFEQRGLSWMIALARAELGTMRAAQTGESSSAHRRSDNVQQHGKPELLVDEAGPFDRWPTTSLDRDAFLEILWDGARYHYYEARTEYALQVDAQGATTTQVTSPQVYYQLLQLDRKLTVAIEMAEALRRCAAGALSPAQQEELRQWISWLDQQKGLIGGALKPQVLNVLVEEQRKKLINQIQGRPTDNASTGKSNP
jgi:hypothetical protein